MTGNDTTREIPTDVLAFGRIGMDLYAREAGPFAEVATFAKSLGGSAANVAVAAARLGRHAALVSGVGDDAPGAYLMRALTAFGVDSRFVRTDANLPTPIVLAALDPATDPQLTFYRSPSAPDLHLDLELPGLRAAIDTARVLWVTGTGLSVPTSSEPTLEAMRMRHGKLAAGFHTVLDLDWRPALWPDDSDPAASYAEALELADIVIGNRIEVATALGRDVAVGDEGDAARELLARGAHTVVVKLGGDGVRALTADGDDIIVAPSPVDVVCGLGAGDAFGGAFCDGLLRGDSIGNIVARASAAGAYVAARLACADVMPTARELDDFMVETTARHGA